ncbi:bicyclomycin resistance protein [Sphaerisporangium krabiense]|uniref:NitT/TauT family transport system substrate-binding protein n=1 Tax=Sphaerisporangium krabiense TaxID=763782 RepID=A0A7W8Z437_9ACTN|nr:aliphatic sulfonate ABC transporter substrate-binding protein [Sphaerisporangium krabiense]MBB5626683.1 NitT/TauT family transport system substrate-binding protein [Sphaerisporangium krabiense]GII63604.1 bicyclomycin resistance protein [Sphaerisporangium krabiense]
MRRPRRLAAAFTAALALLISAACGSSGNGTGAAEPKTVRFGYIADFAGAAVLATADKQGLWAKHGLKPDLKVFTNGPLQIQALGSGDIDFGYIGSGATWLPASGKAKIIAPNMLGQADRIVTHADSGITSVAALKGKKIGVPEGTSGDMILQLALKEAGLTVKDVQKVNMDPSTVVTAFSAKQIDAAAIWYPLIDTIKKNAPGLVELTKSEDYYPRLSFPSSFVARNELVADDTATVTKVLKVIQEADDWIAANTAEAETLTATFLKVPAEQFKGAAAVTKILPTAELVKLTEDGSVAGWYKGLADIFVAMGKLPQSPDPATYFTADLYKSARSG